MKTVVTLTTIPSRLKDENPGGIKKCIESLITQNFKEYEVHFNIPYIHKYDGEEYNIPQWLTEIVETSPILKIFRGEDYGAITKIADTIKRVDNPESIIITADDDLIYHPDMVSEQYKNQTERFENCAVGYDGLRALHPTFFDIRDYYVVSVDRNVKVNILQNYKTVSFKRKYFEEDFFTEFLDKSWADDITVSGYMGKQGIEKIVTYYSKEHIPSSKEEWTQIGGVTTFPVLAHTNHSREEGCFLLRDKGVSDNINYFSSRGYLI